MNQKNIFSIISVVLILQGIVFFLLGDQMTSSTFPDLDEAGHLAVRRVIEVPSALSILIGLITFANRTHPGVLWAYTIGSAILLCVTLKHMFMDHVNVPIPAVVIQALIVLSCAYLWSQNKKA